MSDNEEHDTSFQSISMSSTRSNSSSSIASIEPRLVQHFEKKDGEVINSKQGKKNTVGILKEIFRPCAVVFTWCFCGDK